MKHNKPMAEEPSIRQWKDIFEGIMELSASHIRNAWNFCRLLVEENKKVPSCVRKEKGVVFEWATPPNYRKNFLSVEVLPKKYEIFCTDENTLGDLYTTINVSDVLQLVPAGCNGELFIQRWQDGPAAGGQIPEITAAVVVLVVADGKYKVLGHWADTGWADFDLKLFDDWLKVDRYMILEE